jgi:hypothetical protein
MSWSVLRRSALKYALLRRLPRNSDDPRNGRERVMPHPQRDDLLLPPGDFLPGLR